MQQFTVRVDSWFAQMWAQTDIAYIYFYNADLRLPTRTPAPWPPQASTYKPRGTCATGTRNSRESSSSQVHGSPSPNQCRHHQLQHMQPLSSLKRDSPVQLGRQCSNSSTQFSAGGSRLHAQLSAGGSRCSCPKQHCQRVKSFRGHQAVNPVPLSAQLVLMALPPTPQLAAVPAPHPKGRAARGAQGAREAVILLCVSPWQSYAAHC